MPESKIEDTKFTKFLEWLSKTIITLVLMAAITLAIYHLIIKI